MKQIQKTIFLLAALALVAVFSVLVFTPSQEVSATAGNKQTGVEKCLACHTQEAKLWEGSRHNTGNVNCIVCHKLAISGGAHPAEAKYTVESEETTCLVCHLDVTDKDIADQMTSSRHGKVGLSCISCHEQHAQGLKLSAGSKIVCDNCHKKEMETMLSSTHNAAGLNCINCHMGENNNHTMVSAVETCDQCHSNLHEAKSMLDAGLKIQVIALPNEMVASNAGTPQPTKKVDEATITEGGGIKMPQWTLVFAGMLIGGIISWALVGRDPGEKHSEHKK